MTLDKVPVKTTVYAASAFALPTISMLAQEQRLAGVIVPDPSELPVTGHETSQLLMQLKQAGIRVEICCKEKLELIPSALEYWQSELAVIVTFPYLLPESLFSAYRLGCYNLHASPLPQYPGPNPVYWQIRHQQQETAVTLFRVTDVLDAGDTVVQRPVTINPLDTYLCLGNRLAYEGSIAIGELLKAVEADDKAPQGVAQLSGQQDVFFARRLEPEDCEISFETMQADDISALCRAGNGLPNAAHIMIKGVPVSVLQATAVDYPNYGTKPGTILFIGEPEGLIVGVKNGAVSLDVIGCSDGVYSGLAFAERFQLDAGTQLQASGFSQRKQA